MEQYRTATSARMLAHRMKLSKPNRQRPPIRSRGSAQYLQKQYGNDVWLPTKPTPPKQHQQPNKVAPQAKSQHQNSTTIRVNPANPKVQTNAAPKRIDFNQNAKNWHQSQKKQNLSVKQRSLSQYVLYAMAGTVFLLGIVAALHSFKVSSDITASVQAQSNDLEETKPNSQDMSAYTVAPHMPRYLKIPKFNTFARVKHVGTDKDGKIDVPKNVHDVAWYNDSAIPGSPGGASIIDGHVSGPTQPGSLSKLKNLNEGDAISIERGDGTIIDYQVVKSKIVHVNDVDMAELLLPIQAGSHGLNLISCTGTYNSSTQEYSHRVLVFTKQV